jgi:hypothetical protein
VTPVAGRPGGVRYFGDVVNKNALRAGTLGAVTTLMMLLSPAAFATTGDDPGPGLTVAQTLGLYVAIPILLFCVIAGLVMVTDKSHKKQQP